MNIDSQYFVAVVPLAKDYSPLVVEATVRKANKTLNLDPEISNELHVWICLATHLLMQPDQDVYNLEDEGWSLTAWGPRYIRLLRKLDPLKWPQQSQ